MPEINQNADAQYNKMVNTPVWKLITKLAIPTIISMLVILRIGILVNFRHLFSLKAPHRCHIKSFAALLRSNQVY